jgi:hypothetical protein
MEKNGKLSAANTMLMHHRANGKVMITMESLLAQETIAHQTKLAWATIYTAEAKLAQHLIHPLVPLIHAPIIMVVPHALTLRGVLKW